jgi:uncharacterized protein YwgA
MQNNSEKQNFSQEDFIVNILNLDPKKFLSPFQIQKLFFLLEKRLGKKYFDFKAHHFGPYDRCLTKILDFSDKIESLNINGVTHYKIKENSIVRDNSTFNEQQKNFTIEMINFVKDLSFKELCMSIYKEFPDMAVNSVFFKT